MLQLSNTQLNILGTGMMTLGMSHTEDQQLLGTTLSYGKNELITLRCRKKL